MGRSLGTFLAIATLFTVALGCGGMRVDPEVQQRVDYAKQLDEGSFIQHVSYRAAGNLKDVLEISVIDDVPRSSVSTITEMLVTDDVKTGAKQLGFKQIKIKGGSRTLTEPDTINRTFELK